MAAAVAGSAAAIGSHLSCNAQQRGSNLDNMRDDIHTLLAKEETAKQLPPLQRPILPPNLHPSSSQSQPSSVTLHSIEQCARSEPVLNPRARTSEVHHWLSTAPLAANGANLCQKHVNELPGLVPRASPSPEKRLAGMVYLYKHGVTVSELPSSTPTAAGFSGTSKSLPSVTIVVPTCFHRRKHHSTVYEMMAAQDYLGKLEFLVLDGACTSVSRCNSKLTGQPSVPLAQAAARDKRLRYVFLTNETVSSTSGVEIEHTQQLRSLGQTLSHCFPRPALCPSVL